MSEDRRPDPKERKHPRLWQAYLWWREMNELRKRHLLRISSIERGKCNLDADYEQMILGQFPYSKVINPDTGEVEIQFSVEEFAKREMIAYGRDVGEVWDWLVSIKGIGEPSAAKLLAQFDDVGNFATVSKFWRFSGWGTFEYWVNGNGKPQAPKSGWKWENATKSHDYLCPYCKQTNLEHVSNGLECPLDDCSFECEYGGRIKRWTVPEPKVGWTLKRMIDRNIEGWHSPYNRILKSEVWLVVQNFIRQQTPVYVDLYYAEKERQRKLHPEPVTRNGKKMFTDGHIHNRAVRKVAKIFLQHLWVKWREFDGLPVTKPWVLREGNEGGHNRYIPPPEPG